MSGIDPAHLLARLNEVLSSTIIILAFSLFIYMFTYNWRSAVSGAFAILLTCVCFTFVGDVALFRVDTLDAATPWLKFQWIGIAFTPAAYLHFADAVLRTTNALSLRRRLAVFLAYFFGLLVLLLVIQSDHLVREPFFSPGVTQFRAGPFFWVFTIYFYTTLTWGSYKIFWARARCLTTGARRRMTYLAVSFAAPALGVYPYMLIANATSLLPRLVLYSILLLTNVGIIVMILLMAYSVAFFGAVPLERVVKHNLAHFLLRGPLVAALVIFLIQALPAQTRVLGLPRELILATSIVIVIVISQLVINLAKPLIDGLIFYRDRVEIGWISELDRRLLTTSDLQQALENVLMTICEVLRVRTGFIYNLAARQGPRLETYMGQLEEVNKALGVIDVTGLVERRNGEVGQSFIVQDGFWFAILQNSSHDRYLGLLGVEGRSEEYNLTLPEEEAITFLIRQAELVLEDRRLQQEVFAALKNIIPEIERIQRLRSAVHYSGAPALLPSLTESPALQKDFPQMVRDALSHYWGGPKLTGSPLLSLRVVQEVLAEHDGNAVRALRTVLNQAIEKQRPDGERRMTAAEWLIYNILDLKFVQGMRVRDVAQRLAMSEADLYRKQRLAIEEVARTLAQMETEGQPGQELEPAATEEV